MELPHIGQTCSVCNRNDYLPFRCTSCNKIVCIDHRSDHGSACPLNQTSFIRDSNSVESGVSLRQACDFCHKIALKLELTKCAHCPGHFCLYHRHQVQHECPQLAEDQRTREHAKEARIARQQEALETLRRTHKLDSSTYRAQQATAPQARQPPLSGPNQALARRVRLMKIRQSARGPPNILDGEKIYFEVRFFHETKSSLSLAEKDGKSVNIFTSPRHTIGRMIDWSADELGIVNKNHIQTSDQLIFRKQKVGSGFVDLDSQLIFQKYIESAELESGDELQLTYVLNSI